MLPFPSAHCQIRYGNRTVHAFSKAGHLLHKAESPTLPIPIVVLHLPRLPAFWGPAGTGCCPTMCAGCGLTLRARERFLPCTISRMGFSIGPEFLVGLQEDRGGTLGLGYCHGGPPTRLGGLLVASRWHT